MSTVVNGQVFTNINDLPEVDEIRNGDKLIVETENGTYIIDFANFIIGIDNTSFGSTITENSSNIASLSAQQAVAETYANRFVTVTYALDSEAAGFSFNSSATPLPLNTIQSNTIDGNTDTISSTLVSLASNILSLNPGKYQVSAMASVSGGDVMLDLYNNESSAVLLESDYSGKPTINGQFSIDVRSEVYFRGFANGSRTLGVVTPFANKTQNPLTATFQLISSGL
jgi:hypothetical protein